MWLRILPILLLFSGLVQAGEESNSKPWAWDVGATMGKPGIWALCGGLRYRAATFRVSDGFFWNAPATWWSSTRGELLYSPIHQRWYGLGVGVATTYYYAQAPDSMAMAINNAIGSYAILDHQFEQWVGVGPALSIRYWGALWQCSLPLWQWGDFRRRFEWRAGFTF